MVLPFEKWMKKQGFDSNILSLFNESIICHKVGAYKAAMILSYLGFMSVLKKRILNSDPPSNFVLAEWQTDYQRKLQNDDSWDKDLFDFTQQENGRGGVNKKIFDISSDLREQIRYWKNRRNDCAHHKNQHIEYFHVESFWTFMQSNLPKLVVGGGKEYLLNQIREHFDTSVTPIGLDYDFIIDNIPNGVPQNELKSFFQEVETIIKGYSNGASNNNLANRYLDIYNKVIVSCPSYVKDELVNYIKEDQSKLVDFLSKYPSKILDLNLDSTFVRAFWNSTDSYYYPGKLPIIFSMIRNNLIQPIEFDEVKSILLNQMYFPEITTPDIEVLNSIDFFSLFKNKFINGDPILNYSEGNRIRNLVISCMKNFPINKELVLTITKTFNRDYNPRHLLEDMRAFFKENNSKMEEFKKCATDNHIPLELKYNIFDEN